MRNVVHRSTRPRPVRGAIRETVRGTARGASRGASRGTGLARLADLLESPRYEVLPTAGTADLVGTHLPPGRAVTVTASPAKGLEATLGLATELAGAGYDVVPHLAARMVVDRAHLGEIVERLSSAGVRRVFVPSGDAAQVGDYTDAHALLADLDGLANPFASIGITAYPEPYASVPHEDRMRAMWDKRPYATEAVSNLSFDPRVVGGWLGDLRRDGYPLPLWLGVPGPVDSARMLTIATRIGVGESTRFLLKNRRTIARLLTPGGFSTETFLRRLAPTLARDDAAVAGLHVFTFNQVAQTETWRTGLLARLRDHARPPYQDRGAS